MRLNRREPAPALPLEPGVDPVKRGFGVLLAIAGSVYIAARPLGFMHYSSEAAFGSLAAICFVVLAGIAALRDKTWRAPDGLVLAVILWIAVFIWGALRSPHPGEAVPLATDAILYGLLLLAGYTAGRVQPALRVIFIRAIIAMAAAQAVYSIWQVKVELPRVRQQLESGEAAMPEFLAGKIGLDRLYGDNAQGTFMNPNSLAGYLLVGLLLLLGHSWDALRARAAGIVGQNSRKRSAWLTALCVLVAAVMLFALKLTDSKGALVALAAGVWFFIIQRLLPRFPKLKLLTANGISVGILILALAVAGVLPSKPFGLSLQVRFEYWKAALAMFWRHPLQGVGLGGYGEWYNTFKTPMGWEVRDPHNEYLSLLAELGVLGLLIYAALWWMIFRRARLAGETPAGTEPKPASWLLNLDFLSLLFGALCMWFAIFAMGAFNAWDIINMLRGEFSRAVLAGSVQTLCLPLIFAGVVMLLRADARVHLAASAPSTAVSPMLLHGFRAAAGASLVHQLVDFDFKAQAIVGGLFLCGGMFWAAADTHQEAETVAATPAPRSVLSKASAWMTIACAVLLIPTGVWIPLQTGLARDEAENVLAEHNYLLRHPAEETGADPADLERQIVRERQRAAAAAPYSDDTLVEYGEAKLQFGDRTPFSKDEDAAFEIFRQAERLRPLSPQIKAKLGNIYLGRALKAALDSDTASRVQLELALEKFTQARQIYPLRPALYFMEGDALLFLARSEEAAERYLRAFLIDISINDPNVYLSSIYTDPRPGAFVSHGHNRDVMRTIGLLLQREAGAGQKGSPARIGLLVRRAVGLQHMIKEAERQRIRDPQGLEALALDKIQLVRTSEELLSSASAGAQKAHAALLHALCLTTVRGYIASKDSTDASAAADLKRRYDAAVKLAADLQAQSVKEGKPGTTPWVFGELMKVLNKP